MSVATPEQVAMARRIVAGFYQCIRDHDYATWVLQGLKDGDNHMTISLAAIIETSEAAARLAESGVRLGFEGYDLTGFMGENNRCRAIATALRNGEHLKETEHGR